MISTAAPENKKLGNRTMEQPLIMVNKASTSFMNMKNIKKRGPLCTVA